MTPAPAAAEPGMPEPIHLALQIPEGEVAALASLDLALTLQNQLQALGHPVTVAARRLRPDALNLVIGTGWGFDEETAQGLRVALVLTALPGPDAPDHHAPAWRLAHRWPVLCTSPDTVTALSAERSARADPPPLLPWAPAAIPHATRGPLTRRPLDLLLPQAPTEHQRRTLASLERQGVAIARLEQALHGPEWSDMVAQARAVLLPCPRPGQAPDALRAQLALARGTAVVMEAPESGWPASWPPALAECVLQWPAGQPWPWTPATLLAGAEATLHAEHGRGTQALAALQNALDAFADWWRSHPPTVATPAPRRWSRMTPRPGPPWMRPTPSPKRPPPTRPTT